MKMIPISQKVSPALAGFLVVVMIASIAVLKSVAESLSSQDLTAAAGTAVGGCAEVGDEVHTIVKVPWRCRRVGCEEQDARHVMPRSGYAGVSSAKLPVHHSAPSQE